MAPTRAIKPKPDGARTSARVAINEDGKSDEGKGKKRASMAPPDGVEPKAKRKSKSEEKEKAPRKSRARKGEEPEGEPTTSRSKRNKGRASGVTRFWRNNSSIAGHAAPSKKKDFMSSGMYCQDPDPNSPRKLVNRVLSRRAAELKAARKKGPVPDGERESFPPMPYDYGQTHFFEQEHEFVLPYDIRWAAENGTLDPQKRPEAYQRIRQNAYPERSKVASDVTAVCRCTTECNDNCDNRIMHYTCGKDCPAGDACNNKSLWKRKQPALKVSFAGPRGFGLFAAEDINEGDFVIDYRGEIISLSTFYGRCNATATKNYYALAYDQDEVIDAATRGNEARFINHGCQPNLEVRKLSTLGDGVEEYEVGMWASRDISKGEELYYDYNFDSFAAATATECKCGAPNCVGFLGRNPGEKSSREKALEADLAESTRKATKKQVKQAVKSATKKASVKGKPKAKSGKGQSRESAAARERNKRVKQRQLREMRALRAAELEAKAPPPVVEEPIDRRRGKGGRKGKRVELNPEEEEARKEEARKRRISGWADWLKKKASEKSRTREEWQDFANKRRRGKAWMEGMMQEYGVAAYDGGPAEPYVSTMLADVPATLQPKRRGPPPGTPRAPRQPKAERPVSETDAERALRSLGYEIPEEPQPEFDPATVDFDQMAVEDLFAGDPPTVDYFETQQRYTAPHQLSQQSNARESSQPYSLAHIQQIQQAVEAQAEEAIGHLPTEEQTEELRQRAIAIVSSIQPQNPSS